MALKEYRDKRKFARTPEPKGKVDKRKGPPRFVVQEHHATRKHWDFRLEMAGVLKSWAVPKGLTYDPDEKRLAVPVEDHPLGYMEFEGVIPEGNYGAGAVMVWDLGTYGVLEGDPLTAYNNGKLTLILRGKKLRGEFHMVRTKMGGQTQWLMFKKRDGDAEPGWTLPSPSTSATTGRTIDQIKADASARWQPDRETTGSGIREQGLAGRRSSVIGRGRTGRGRTSTTYDLRPTTKKVLKRLGIEKPGPDPYPQDLRPMLATVVEKPFDNPKWLFEIKWDGVRTIAYVRREGAESRVDLRSRGGHAVNHLYPEVVDALYGLPLPDAVLDGEIVALDDEGRSHFQLLQSRLQPGGDGAKGTAPLKIAYYVFDLLYLNGHSLLDHPLKQRREALAAVVPQNGTVRLSDAVPGEGKQFYEAAQALRVEGIVGKQEDSAYQPGRRAASWVKIKITQRLDAVVGGYTEGRRARAKTFGALLLGAYDRDGALHYIGHCGGGFTDAELRRVYALLRARAESTCPFAEVPPTNERPTWVRPELVADVEYGGWTADKLLRFPVYKGLRDDKSPRDIVLDPRIRRSPGSGRKSPVASRQSLVPGPQSRSSSKSGPKPTPGIRGANSWGGLPDLPVEFTNLDKVFWPQQGYTKGDLIRYYLEVGSVILPHLRDRPLTLRRFPDGIAGESFYQKDYPDAPSFVEAVRIWTESGKDTLAAPLCNNLATLLWLAQLADIEIHTWFSRTTPLRRVERAPAATVKFADSEAALRGSVLNRPDCVVFDIDPYIFPDNKLPARKGEKDPDYSRRGFDAATEAALLLRGLLKTLRLDSFVKTSGKTGLHVFVPIVRRYTFEQTHAFAKTVTQYLEGRYPKKVTTEWAAQKRVGKVFLDYNQNRIGATLASAYSVRPTPEATVSVPLTWKELERGLNPLRFTLKTVPGFMKKRNDPWAQLMAKPQRLEEQLGRRKKGR